MVHVDEKNEDHDNEDDEKCWSLLLTANPGPYSLVGVHVLPLQVPKVGTLCK